jgi:ribosomal protein L12E/L44/L45/RPP1/RPP2
VKLSGPVWNPTVADVDLKSAVASIVKSAGSNLLSGLLGQNANQAADQQKQQGEQRVRDEAEKQKRKIQEDAQNKLKGLFGR